jgi:hypothetical protein
MRRSRHTWPTRGSQPTGSGPHRGLHHSPCVPRIVPAGTWGPLYTPTCMSPNISSTVSLGHAQTNHACSWLQASHRSRTRARTCSCDKRSRSVTRRQRVTWLWMGSIRRSRETYWSSLPHPRNTWFATAHRGFDKDPTGPQAGRQRPECRRCQQRSCGAETCVVRRMQGRRVPCYALARTGGRRGAGRRCGRHGRSPAARHAVVARATALGVQVLGGICTGHNSHTSLPRSSGAARPRSYPSTCRIVGWTPCWRKRSCWRLRPGTRRRRTACTSAVRASWVPCSWSLWNSVATPPSWTWLSARS